MDELRGLVGGMVIFIVSIALLAATIAILAPIVIAVAMIVGPPVGLGVVLWRLLAERYTLSVSKKRQCAAFAAVAFVAPFLVLFAASSPMTWIAAVWGGTVLAMFAVVLLLVTAAFQQYFGQHRESILEARFALGEQRFRQKVASWKLRRLNRTLNRIERTHSRRLRAHEKFATQMAGLVERNDPALCGASISLWESQYSALPVRQIEIELKTVSTELATVPESNQVVAKLKSLFLEMHVIRRKLDEDPAGPRLQTLKAARKVLHQELVDRIETMKTCKRAERRTYAVIAQLKSQRLVLQ